MATANVAMGREFQHAGQRQAFEAYLATVEVELAEAARRYIMGGAEPDDLDTPGNRERAAEVEAALTELIGRWTPADE